MKIKTLADILAEQNLPDSHTEQTNNTVDQINEQPSSYFEDDPAFEEFISVKEKQLITQRSVNKDFNHHNYFKSDNKKRDTKKKTFNKGSHQKSSYQKRNSINHNVKDCLDNTKRVAQVKSKQNDEAFNSKPDSKDESKPDSKIIDNLATKLQPELKTPEQRQIEKDEIKADARLRWLAFYYLSNREHSAQELKDKLLAKEQEAYKIDELLKEFEEKGYQSDMRTALMLIREGIRKGRGRRRIKQDFFKRKVAVPANIDELIDIANEESEEFADYTETDVSIASNGKEQVNWLKLAVNARVKKYGESVPTEPKEKARQLRFLQYRGFNTDICFKALQHDLESVAEVF